MADHDIRFEELLPAHSLGALEGEELASLEKHLERGCDRCERQLREWSRQTEALAESVPPVEPSEHARARILKRITAESAGPKQGSLPAGWQRVAAAAVLLVVAWSGWSQLSLRREVDRLTAVSASNSSRLRQVDSELRQVDSELRQVSGELQQARGQALQASRAARIVGSQGVRAVGLAGLAGAPGASAETLVDPVERRAVFYAANLPPAPSGKTYQLWFIESGVPVSAGTFYVDAEGSGSLIVESVASPEAIQAWAVTVEPAGGVPQPTGEMVLKG